MGFIYKIHNIVNGKAYIGQTRCKDVETRFKQHLYRAKTRTTKRCRALFDAIIKYGDNNFTIEQLLQCEDHELDYFEDKLIVEHNTMSPNGYNLKLGGYLSEESLQRIRDKLREVVDKPEWRQNLSERFKRYDKTLPMYVETRTMKGEIVGYRVDHPKGRKTFADKDVSMEEKYKLAIAFLEECNQSEDKIAFKNMSGVKYIKSRGYGFRVPDSHPNTLNGNRLRKKRILQMQ